MSTGVGRMVRFPIAPVIIPFSGISSSWWRRRFGHYVPFAFPLIHIIFHIGFMVAQPCIQVEKEIKRIY